MDQPRSEQHVAVRELLFRLDLLSDVRESQAKLMEICLRSPAALPGALRLQSWQELHVIHLRTPRHAATIALPRHHISCDLLDLSLPPEDRELLLRDPLDGPADPRVRRWDLQEASHNAAEEGAGVGEGEGMSGVCMNLQVFASSCKYLHVSARICRYPHVRADLRGGDQGFEFWEEGKGDSTVESVNDFLLDLDDLHSVLGDPLRGGGTK